MSGKRKKIRTVWSVDALHNILSSEIVVGYTLWSDLSVTVVVGYEKSHIEVPQDVWEEFNLRYNWSEFS